MSEIVARITPATTWTAATPSMTITAGAKGILIKAGGSITITGVNGVSLALSSTVDTIFPLVPFSVTAASSAYVLS